MMPRRLAAAPAGEFVPGHESDCAREPIHIPGAIQPHGAILAVGAGGMISHASANLAEILGHDAATVLGHPLTAVFDLKTALVLMTAAIQPSASAVIHMLTRPDGQLLELRAHKSGDRICVDIEPVHGDRERVSALLQVQSIRRLFNGAASCVELCELAVRALKQATGYHRVMAYRFAPGGHGEVVAEAVEPGLPQYLGLHYPDGDIPAQARRLFLRQRVAAVANSSYVPVPVLVSAAPDEAPPLDLTHSSLRSISPVHCQYMRNMQTAASLTVALVHQDALWGMLVCHNAKPFVPGPELRAVADSIGHIVSSGLADLTSAELAAEFAAKAETLAAIGLRLAAPLALAPALAAAGADLLSLVGATGAVIRYGGQIFCVGSTPPLDAAEQALGILQPLAQANIFAADDLGLRYPALAACTMRGSGALLLALSTAPDDAILWFRPELSRTVLWGGNPRQHDDPAAAGESLTPRKSFAAWKEIVSGRSSPWTQADVQLARELRSLIEHETGQRTRAELARLRADMAANGTAEAGLPALRDNPQPLEGGLPLLLFDAAPDAMVVVNGAGDIRFVNLQAEKDFGYYGYELIGQPIDMLIPQRFRGGSSMHREGNAADPRRGMAAGSQPFGLRKNGSEFPVEIAVSNFATADGLLFTAAIRNISVRKNAEKQIARIDRQNRDLLEASPDVMVMFKGGGEIVLLNRQAEAQFGYPRHELAGKSIETIIPYGKIQGAESIMTLARANHSSALVPASIELVGLRKNGTEFPAEITLGFAVSGEESFFTAAIRDITVRTALEARTRSYLDELERSNKELAQFASVASHDLQEPLRMVISYTQLLGRRYKGKLDSDADDFIDFAVQGALRMQQLIRDLLDYCRLGAKDVELVDTASADALQMALTDLGPLIKSSGAIITIGALPRVMADAAQLSRVFQNLLTNAIKFHASEAPKIDILAEPAGAGKWLFSVRDNGLGIEAQYFERIFGMYQRLHSRDEFSGTGIGLAICKKIIEHHQGRISVQSRLGEGSVFQFTMLAGGIRS